MNKAVSKIEKRNVRHRRIRSEVIGTADMPRLAVFRSNTHIYAQIINDADSKTIAAASDIKAKSGSKLEKAVAVGKEIAEKAKQAKIDRVVFDRGGFLYAGRVKALADSARDNGLKF